MSAALTKEAVLALAPRIPWDHYVGPTKAKEGSSVFLTEDDVKIIKKYAAEEPTALAALFSKADEGARRYPQCLMKLLVSTTDARLIQYALALLEDFIVADPVVRCPLLVKPGSTSGASDGKPYVLPFLQLVGTSGSGARVSALDADPFILERAASIAATMLATDAGDPLATSSLLAWIMTHVKQYGSAVPAQAKVTEVAVTALAVVLRNDFLRRLFVEERGVERLVAMASARSAQLVYEVTFCLWAISLVPDYCPELERTGAVTAVGRIFRAGMPVKVLRVAAALLVNVSRHPACGDSVAEVCETHVPEVVEMLLGSDPRLSDPELLDDLHWLSDAIKGNKRKLTSMERYERELLARRFEWTPVHSPEFWKEHATSFETGDFRLIKALAELLSDPGADNTTLAVAVADLGQFAVAHPQGRQLLATLGVRPAVLALLKSGDDEVKQQCLLACSKMLLNRWQFVSGNVTPTAAAVTAK